MTINNDLQSTMIHNPKFHNLSSSRICAVHINQYLGRLNAKHTALRRYHTIPRSSTRNTQPYNKKITDIPSRSSTRNTQHTEPLENTYLLKAKHPPNLYKKPTYLLKAKQPTVREENKRRNEAETPSCFVFVAEEVDCLIVNGIN